MQEDWPLRPTNHLDPATLLKINLGTEVGETRVVINMTFGTLDELSAQPVIWDSLYNKLLLPEQLIVIMHQKARQEADWHSITPVQVKP